VTRFRCTAARTPAEIADAQRVRWIVYGEEERLLPPGASRGGREVDARDDDEDVVHLLVHAADEPIGTVRLLLARTRAGARGGPSPRGLGLELESRFDLVAPPALAVVAGEVTRYCVLRRYRCTPAARMLYNALAVESRRQGVTHWFAAANMETDCAEDAALVYDLVRARDLIDHGFHAEPRPLGAPSSPPSGSVRPTGRRRCYTDEERLQAHAGGRAALHLPRAIALFTGRMGARCMGAPAYDPHFSVFALPIVAQVAPSGR
jgi:L-ornithine Nalpha-acyltransferase